MPPKLARMNTSTALDTIAGSKLLQLRFGRAGDFQPNQAVIHDDRRARFIRVSDGAAIIRYWGDDRSVAVPLESISLPPERLDDPALRAPAVANAHRASSTNRPRLVPRVRLGSVPRRRPLLRP
jgi:hypothetical protein